MLVSNWLGQKELLYDVVDGGSGSSAGAGENASASSASDKPDPTKNQNDGVSFSQDDVNKVAAKARTEGKQAALKALLEELGLESPDTLKTLVKTAKEQQEAQLSEADKLRKQLEKAEAEMKAKDDAIAKQQQATQLERRNNAVITALQGLKTPARKPQDVVILMDAKGLLTDLLKEDGTVDAAAVTRTVEAFQKENPEFFSPTSPGSPSNQGGRTPAPDSTIKVPKIRL